MANRASSDVDLFAEASGEFDFAEAVGAIITAYQRDGLEVRSEVLAASFARLDVRSAADSAKVELGLDWRKNRPVSLAVGPVLHADDAVANKVCALFGRAEVRDYVDVDAVLASGRYSEDELLTLAADHDPGFDRSPRTGRQPGTPGPAKIHDAKLEPPLRAAAPRLPPRRRRRRRGPVRRGAAGQARRSPG